MQEPALHLVRTQRTAGRYLPIPPTPLVGRAQHVRTVCELLQLPDVRLLTLTGTAGVGKTRLALQAAADVMTAFADGAQFVPLASLSDPDLVLPTIAHAFGLQEKGEQPALALLTMSLRAQQVLLVLDNFEHLMPAAAHVAALLEGCPELTLLVTSREVLHVRAERQFVVPPLALPLLTAPDRPFPLDVDALAQQPAVQLFLQRVQAIHSDLQLTRENARAIAEICHRLDGLPLALELAAARIKVLSPQALLARLAHRLEILTGGARDLPARQQTLRTTIAWSYSLLDAAEQRLFRRLSTFVGGWTLAAADALCSTLNTALETGHTTTSVIDDIASLLNKSLLHQTQREGEEPRFSMLETIREYGLECLRERAEVAACQQAHALCMVALAEEAESHLKSARQLEWLRQLEVEQGNIRAALGWLIEQEEADLSLRLAGACWRFWFMRGYYGEGYRWLEAALGLPQANQRTAPRAKALCGAGWLSSFLHGDAVSTRALLEESVAFFRELGDKGGLSEALSEFAEGVLRRDDTTAARALFEECAALAREAGDPWLLAMALRTLGWFLYEYAPGEAERAVRLLEESTALSRELGDAVGLSRVLTTLTRVALAQGRVERAAVLAQENLTVARAVDSQTDVVDVLNSAAIATLFQGDVTQAVDLLEECIARAQALGDTGHSKGALALAQLTLGGIALQQGHLQRATPILEQSLGLARAVGFQDRVALALAALGAARRAQGDLAQATALCSEGVALAREIGYTTGVGKNLMGLAHVAADEGHPQRAARLFAAAATWMLPSVALDPLERAGYERAVEQVREHLGETAFALAWAQGQGLTPEDALAARAPVTAAQPAPSRTPARPTFPHGLTAREVEVLRLVAHALTNAQIAERLVVSPHTVNNHVRSILSKLGVSSRSGATRFAVEQQLL